ncbi:40957_t:CDS:2 [Gigaspora margarita]|uniref:40957_t:CDS:1 n=1 Tax=Gigaspora margarita TaxID=4874 RepID=A0ABN7WJI6_GIGMA|nr:40957_t:CDS:2 [Gigaspora margarita]
MPPSTSSGNDRCPACGRHFKYLEKHVSRIHRTTLSELQRLRRNITTQRRSEESSQQENTNDSTDSPHQGTPNSLQVTNSINDENFILW